MQIKDIMTKNPEVIAPDAPLQEAAEKMDSLNVGSLPVCDGQKLLGMITDRDIVVRATARGGDSSSTAVRDVMSRDVVYCYEDDDVAQAALVMEDKQIRRLPIMSRDNRLVGILALGDLAVDAQYEKLHGEVTHEVSKPAKPDR
jgi:CBS domain-containing protein